MNNQGAVNPSALLELFQELSASGKIYRLEFVKDNGVQVNFIYQDDGLLYIPKDGQKGLEQYLIGEGVISFEQSEELIKYKKESGIPLDQLVVQADIVSEEALKKIWVIIARDNVIDLFTCENGQYNAQELLTKENSPAVFNLSELSECEGDIHQMLSNVAELGGLSSVYQIAGSGQINSGDYSADTFTFVNAAINGSNNLADIILKSIYPTTKTLKIFSELKSANKIKIGSGDNNSQKEKSTTEAAAAPAKQEPAKDSSSEQTANSSDNINGSLSFLSLVEVMQTLNNVKKTGVLTIDVPNGPGVLNILNGELAGASFGALKNKDAFYKLVTFKEGNFRFISGEPKFAKEMDIPTMSLLMEAMRLTDEGGNQNVSAHKSSKENESSASSSQSSSGNKSYTDEAPRSSRVLKRKESKLAFLVKLGVFFAIVIYFSVYLFVVKPANEKKLAFDKPITDADNHVSNNRYIQALDVWNAFAVSIQKENPEWEIEINEHKKNITEKLRELVNKVEKEVETATKSGDYLKAIEKLDAAQKFMPSEKEDSKKIFEKDRSTLIKLREQVTKQQKETDYKNWKSNFEAELKKAKELIAEFEHDKAVEKLNLMNMNLDKTSDQDLIIKIMEQKKIVQDRENFIQNAMAIINDKNTTFSSKIDAYGQVIQNAGIKQPRGVQANKDLQAAKEKMSSYEAKFKSILQAKAKEPVAVRIQLIEQLQKDISSKEELQFLEKEKEKILDANKESMAMMKSYQDYLNKKDFANAFIQSKKIIDASVGSELPQGFAIPFKIDSQSNIVVKINNETVALPFFGLINGAESVKLVAEKPGCKPISRSLDKTISEYEVKLVFYKSELWSTEYKGDLNIPPEICLNGKGIVNANKNNYEMLLIDNGSRIWQRQINNPSKPFKKAAGTNVIIGDDDFWNIESSPTIFENYIGISGKNSELFVLNAEDGNHLVKYETNFYSKCAPMIVRLTLLGNKAYAYSGSIDGNLICIAIDDQSVRFQEKISDANNCILGVYQLNDSQFVVITEQNAQCFQIVNSKQKWNKLFNSKVKEIFKFDQKIYVRQTDGLLEINENVENWKLSTFPIREVKEIIKNANSLIVKGEKQVFHFDEKHGKFQALASKLENVIYCFGNKCLVQENNTIKCLEIDTLKELWSTEASKDKIVKSKIVGNYLLYKEGDKLHAVSLE